MNDNEFNKWFQKLMLAGTSSCFERDVLRFAKPILKIGWIMAENNQELEYKGANNILASLKKYKGVARYYAGEPFESNNIYLKIFDHFKVAGPSTQEFNSEEFSKVAREALELDQEFENQLNFEDSQN